MNSFCRFIPSLVSTVILALFLLGVNPCHGQILPGQSAPPFKLMNVEGKGHDLEEMKGRSMIILYFFDAESKSNQEGLLSINELKKKYDQVNLLVWGITLSPRNKVSQALSHTEIDFPILLDTSGASDLYHARSILPTVCVLGPGFKVVDFIQGGGKTTEIMLERLAGRELQRNTRIAKAISEQVTKENPRNLNAKVVKGYAELKDGNLADAEKSFQDLSQQKGEGEVLGKEGLATLYAKKGETQKAMVLAQEVEQKAPDRAYIHVVKGDLLYGQNKKSEAEAEYRKAVEKKSTEPYQKAQAYNKLGRLHAALEKYESSRELYDQAIELNPFYVEATSNKGVTYEKEGRYDKAMESYQKTLSLDGQDPFTAVLVKKAQEMLELQKDSESKKRVDSLIKELTQRYAMEKKPLFKGEDTWTSRPMILTFVDFQEKGALPERDGLSIVLATRLADLLNSSGRVQVVERVIIERLLSELNLGSSELADPETALKLGKVLAAKLIGTGVLHHLPDRTILNLRVIDTETGGMPMVVNTQIDPRTHLEKEIYQLNRGILNTVIEKYPLRGYLVETGEDKMMINLGSNQGVVLGTRFDVLEEPKPVNYKGKTLRGSPEIVAQVEIVQVEPDLSYARVMDRTRELKRDDKVEEKRVTQ
jgi:tetratricopeptide (TPR) repeat protein/peroxiredoxin